jgi:hypothetical protein
VEVWVSRGIKKPLTNFERTYFWLFALSLVVCWSPSKALPYLLPLLITGILVSFKFSLFYRFLMLIGAFFSWAIVAALFSSLEGREFLLQNVVLSFVTYSAFYPILVTPRRLLTRTLYERMSRLMITVLLVEGMIGYVQVFSAYLYKGSFDLATGDAAEGTIHLALRNGTGFETKIFAMNMGLGLLVALPYLIRGRKWTRIGFLTFIFLLASVMHLTFSMFVALIAASIMLVLWRNAGIAKRIKWGIIGVGCTTLLGVMTWYLMPTNVRLASKMLEVLNRNPKIVVVSHLIERYPVELFVGFGPGQGLSRAAMIVSGEYLDIDITRLPLMQVQKAPLVEESGILDFLGSPVSRNSILRPLSSWIAMLSEAGWLGGALFLVTAILIWRRYKKSSDKLLVELFAFYGALLFIFLSGVFEFYWEVPQAILPGLLLLKALGAGFLPPNNRAASVY